MTQVIQVNVEPRTVIGKGLPALRRAGYAPANVYGGGAPSIPVQIKVKTLQELLSRVTPTTLIDLTVGTSGDVHRVFLRAVQQGWSNPQPMHVDFFAVRLDHLLRTSIPLALRGEAPAAASGNVILISPTTHLNVEGRPGDLPPVIDVDISGLTALDQQIVARDLRLPAHVTLLDDPTTLIARVQLVRGATSETATEGTPSGASSAEAANH